jgi:hypothetical protein
LHFQSPPLNCPEVAGASPFWHSEDRPDADGCQALKCIIPDWTAKERDAAANAVAAILDSLGFAAMGADCGGDCLHADLPRYAQFAAKHTARQCPHLALKVRVRLAALGLLS